MKDIQDYKFPFEKLQVWHLAKDFAKQVYCLTCDFPATERYGLTSQINRAAVSVMSNLAEGSSRTSRKDQAHFSQMSFSSLMEVACQLQLAQELDFISVEHYCIFRTLILELAAKINALRRSQIGDR